MEIYLKKRGKARRKSSMPELDKSENVLNSKIKDLTESGKKIFSDGSVSQQSFLDQLTLAC